jgi:hypothetical protein
MQKNYQEQRETGILTVLILIQGVKTYYIK